MPLYESTFIARHDLSSQQVEALAESLSGIISDGGGRITKTEFWGLKNLAFRIKKNRKGHYVHVNLDAPPSAVQEFERNMRINEDVLRYLTVRVDELDPNPSPMMQARAARDDRSRRGGRGRSEAAESGGAKSEGDKGKAAKADAAAEDKGAKEKKEKKETKEPAEKPAEKKETKAKKGDEE